MSFSFEFVLNSVVRNFRTTVADDKIKVCTIKDSEVIRHEIQMKILFKLALVFI